MPDRFSKVDKHVLRGGMPTPTDLKILRDKYGVRKVVSLDGPIGNDINSVCNELGLNHVILPLEDGNSKDTPKLPDEVIKWPEDGRVYVHCRYGKDRTSMACAMYRILVNDWNTGDAINEAYKFGMGKGLPKRIHDSYYEAVRKYTTKDNNDVSDIVRLHRDKVEEVHPKPGYQSFNPVSSPFGGEDQGPLGMQQSFAPFIDSTQNHLNMSASLRYRQIIRFAKMVDNGYIYLYSDNVLAENNIWADNIHFAKQFSKNNSNVQMYRARILNSAKVERYNYEPNQKLIDEAKAKGADVAVFHSQTIPTQYFIFNPYILMDIENIGENEDQNNALMIGQHDNYTGAANLVYPGSGGFMGPSDGGTLVPGSGGGGFAGFVQLPYMQGL